MYIEKKQSQRQIVPGNEFPLLSLCAEGPHLNAFAISPHWLCLLYSWLTVAIGSIWRKTIKSMIIKESKWYYNK